LQLLGKAIFGPSVRHSHYALKRHPHFQGNFSNDK
jgi:hypothetical protein